MRASGLPLDVSRISLTLRPQDALYVSAALRYYVDTVATFDDEDAYKWDLPIRRNKHVLARLARALNARGYGYVEPVE